LAILGKESESFSTVTGTRVATARRYFDRVDTRKQIFDSFLEIYGTELRSEPDPNAPGEQIQAYVNARFNKKIANQMVEALCVGFGPKVASALASLFTEPDNKFSLTHEVEDKDVKPAEELLEAHRKEGGYKTAIVDADKIAVETGSSAIFVNAVDNWTTYEHFGPDDIRIFPGKTVEKNGKTRAADPKKLADADHIIICFGESDTYGEWNYLAIYRQSKAYPLGRWVIYTAGDTVEVPKYGSKKIIQEYVDEEDGQRCNPLSRYAVEHPDLFVPEYPLVIFNGGLNKSKDIMPVTMSLHESCLELSRASSHTLSRSQIAATGTRALEKDLKSDAAPVPDSLSGDLNLSAGQHIVSVPHDAAACEIAYTIIKGLTIDAASGFGVPDYMVVTEDHTLDASSGRALEIKARPLVKARNDRIEKNLKAVRTLYQIEQAYISMFAAKTTDESVITLLEECSQNWEPGELDMPQDDQEVATTCQTMSNLGAMDTIEVTRRFYQLPTDVEAMEFYQKMKDRAEKYPPLNQEEEPPAPEPEKPIGIRRKRRSEA
jgi:hypothetical protein